MKVFCIGFQKTGTTSLGKALDLLGYKVCGPVGTLDPDFGDKALEIALKYTDKFDAFQDHPWPLLYKELDRLYPGSKFILTTRDPESWLDSVTNFFGPYDDAPDRIWLYGAGSPIGNEQVYLDRYLSHTQEVLEYFKDRPNDLLVMDFAKGQGWRKLCRFLGKRPPRAKFPHLNKRGSALGLILSHIPGLCGKVVMATTRAIRSKETV